MAPRTTRRILTAALLVLGVHLGPGCTDDPLPAPKEQNDDFPAQVTYDYITRHSRDAVPVWELYGESATKHAESDVMLLTGVKMIFFRDGERDAVLTANSGEVDQETEATVARGNVVVVTEDGRRLESEVLYWDPERALIHTEEFVEFTEGDQVLTGYGLETDPDLTNVTIMRDVRGASRDESAASGDGEG